MAFSTQAGSFLTTYKVTIAIPTHNRISFLKEALESALSQTYKNIEIVVSNNASDDGTSDRVSGLVKSSAYEFTRDVRAVRCELIVGETDGLAMVFKTVGDV